MATVDLFPPEVADPIPLGGVPREQKMLKGYLPRVVYHQVSRVIYHQSQTIHTRQPKQKCEAVRGGLVFKADRPLYHSTLGSRVIEKNKKTAKTSEGPDRRANLAFDQTDHILEAVDKSQYSPVPPPLELVISWYKMRSFSKLLT